MLHFYDNTMKRTFFLLVIVVLPLMAVAGVSDKKKYKKKLHKAEIYFDKGDYYNAMVIFEELLAADSSSKYINYHVGVCKFHLQQFKKEALKYIEKADESVSQEIYYYLGILYHQNQKFDIALENFTKYQKVEVREREDAYIKQLISNISTAKKFLTHPLAVEILNLGEGINSVHAEYVPLITADGNKLFFTSRRPNSTGGEKDLLGNYFEDIYYSVKSNDEWGTVVQLPAIINTTTHDACVGLTPEGENLLIFRTHENLISGDIYLSESDGNNWNTPVLLDPIINSADWNEPSACYSPDGEIIYFSSNRPGGFGGKDLYRSVKLPNGKWSVAINLGANINTPFDEDAPFVHANGKEFYFSSKGHENMGGYDVFKSIIDSSGTLQKAFNMGYPINTVGDDIYLVLAADGQTGYISSAREGGIGETDIYLFRFTSMDPGYVVSEGFVKNEQGEPLPAKITVIETDMMKIHGIYKSNRLTGKFIYLHCENHTYELIIESEGYFSKTIYLQGDEVEILDVELKSIKE